MNYYRVTRNNFLWKQGAIIKKTDSGGYIPLEDIWNVTPVNGDEYISARIVEHPNNEEFFQRVYPDSIAGKTFRTKDQMITFYQESFKK